MLRSIGDGETEQQRGEEGNAGRGEVDSDDCSVKGERSSVMGGG